MERREAKMRGERERQPQLNAEVQKIAKRGKKAFLSKQCKEIEENNRMGKTRHLAKKTGDIKGTFPARMGTVKDRKGKDLIGAEEIKTRWQEYTEEQYKTGFNDADNHEGVLTDLESDILECGPSEALLTTK